MNSLVKACVFSVMCVGWSAHGQSPAGSNPAEQVGGGASKVITALQQAKEYMKAENLPQGKSGENYYIIGHGELACKPGSPEYDQCLFFAFTSAMLDAKKQLAEKLSAEIESEVQSISAGGSEMFGVGEDGKRSIPNLAARIALREEAKKLEADLFAKMKADGKNTDDALVKEQVELKAYQASAAKLNGTESFKNAVKTVARAETSGVVAMHCFASAYGSGDVAVVCALTPRSRVMARAMVGAGPVPPGTAKQSISDWASSAGDDNLAAMFGVQTRTNEKGDLCLVAFGQASPDEENSVLNKQAKARARLHAQQAIRQFAGEVVATMSMANESMSVASMAGNFSKVASDKAFREEINARAEKLSITGIETAYQWDGDHPLSGKKVFGVVLCWNLSNSKEANQLRDMLNAVGGSKGGDGGSKQLPDGATDTGKQQNQPRKKSIQGVPVDKDDL